jgi:hypothetical protein
MRLAKNNSKSITPLSINTNLDKDSHQNSQNIGFIGSTSKARDSVLIANYFKSSLLNSDRSGLYGSCS